MESELTLREIEKKIYQGKKLTTSEQETLAKKTDILWKEHPDVTHRFPRWKKYIAWVAGYQLFDYNKISKKLVEVPLARKRKLIFNHLRSFVRTIVSKLAADIPRPSVIPKTTEYDDIQAARGGDAFIKGLSEKIDVAEQVNNAKLWTVLTNRAFFRVFWNKDDYGILKYERMTEEVENPETGEVTEQETGEIIEIKDEGDVCIESVSPFNCRIDPLYFNHDKWRWFIYGEEVDAAELEEEYGLKKGTLKDTAQNTFDDAYTLELQDEHDVLIGSPDKTEVVTGRTIVLKELWTPKIFAFIAGRKLLEYGKNDYEEIPFYDIEDRLIPISNYERGFSYNEPPIKDAIPVQREYNRQASIVSLAIDRASKLKVLTPFGALPSKKMWTNDFGVFIDYNRNMGEPHQMKLDPLPTDIHLYQQKLLGEFENVMSIHPASFGQLPERASHASGTLVNLLLEQDDAVLNPLLNRINKALSRAWSLALRIVRDNYSLPRMVKFIGENGRESIKKFRGADLKGNTDVKVISQTGLPRSRALRIEYIMRLHEMGLIEDKKDVLEMMEFGQAEKIFEDNLLHENVAYKENEKIEENPNIDPRMVEQWVYGLEDSAIHLKIHLRFRLSPRYNRLNDNQKQALEIMIQKTQEKLQQEQEAQLEQMAKIAQLQKGEGSVQQGQPEQPQ